MNPFNEAWGQPLEKTLGYQGPTSALNFPFTDKIEESWKKSFGHGSKNTDSRSAEKRLTCLGDGTPGTGCHGSTINHEDGSAGGLNAHGSRNQVLLSSRFDFDRSGSDCYEPDVFKLCNDCHAHDDNKDALIALENVFGVKEGGLYDTNNGWGGTRCNDISAKKEFPPHYPATGLTTNFANTDSGWMGPVNLHWLHLGTGVKFRGNITNYKGTVCTTCHNVHGSNTQYGALYDEFGQYHYEDGGNTYASYRPDFFSSNGLNPTFCSSCHNSGSPILQLSPRSE